ncbi:MAG: hypothetical protein ACLTAQ_07140 [Longicatena caecimuris]
MSGTWYYASKLEKYQSV